LPVPGGIDSVFSKGFTILESGAFEIEAPSVRRKVRKDVPDKRSTTAGTK
jgi:hypothetical protein